MNDSERDDFARETIMNVTEKCENILESVQVFALIQYIWWQECISNYGKFKADHEDDKVIKK